MNTLITAGEQELREEIAALRAEVAALREQLGTTGMRLGPRPETQAEIDRRTARLIEATNRPTVLLNPPPVDRSAQCTTTGEPVDKVRAEQTNETGQHKGYIVLCEEERKKGFVRPYRDAYKHVGRSQELVNDAGEIFQGPCIGGCGVVTSMGRALSETYARDPGFYGATFCVQCNKHFPVAEFTWTEDGARVGS